jgi:hypothetical protein
MEQYEIEEILSCVFKEEDAREELARELLKEANPNYTEQELDDFIDFMDSWEVYDTDPLDIIDMYQKQKESK